MGRGGNKRAGKNGTGQRKRGASRPSGSLRAYDGQASYAVLSAVTLAVRENRAVLQESASFPPACAFSTRYLSLASCPPRERAPDRVESAMSTYVALYSPERARTRCLACPSWLPRFAAQFWREGQVRR